MFLVRALFIAVMFALAGSVALIAIFPEDDLAVTRWFWSAGGGFWLTEHGWAALLRRVSMWPTIAIDIAALVSLFQHVVAPASRQFMSARAALFLTLTVAAAPVILVNGILKEHWERGRPVHVTAFGGPGTFTPVSGESSGAAWLAAPALLAPPAARPAALAAVAVYTALVSVLRIAFGGHFLSDTLIAILLTLGIVAAAYHWFYRRPGRPDEATLAARLARIGAPLRRLAGRNG
jgi:lipid A 4'-phosphatase